MQYYFVYLFFLFWITFVVTKSITLQLLYPMKFLQYIHRSLTPYRGCSLSTIPFSQGNFRISKQDRQTQGIRLQAAFPIPKSGSHLKLYMEEFPIYLPLSSHTTFFFIPIMSTPSISWRWYIFFHLLFCFSFTGFLLYDLIPCTLILFSNSYLHVTTQLDTFSPIIVWASIIFLQSSASGVPTIHIFLLDISCRKHLLHPLCLFHILAHLSFYQL